MSTFMIEPGTRLTGRYRLDDRVSEAGGSALWKATDEILARPVAVRTFAEDFPRATQAVRAAQAASRVTDSRLAQVFDADDTPGAAYIVMEWVAGEHLDDLLSEGPLDPGRAAALVAEAAEALAAAHAAGLAHLCLTPRSVIWTVGGSVKILGLGVDAVLGEVDTDDPAAADAVGLGRLLYAALTGHWPGPEKTTLPAAPLIDGRVGAPRQVRAGVPGHLDAVACRALFGETRRGAPPLRTPAQVAEALADVPRHMAVPIPQHPAALSTVQPHVPEPAKAAPPTAAAPAPGHPRPGSHHLRRALLGVTAVTMMGVIGAGGWMLGRTFKPTAPTRPPTAKATSASPVVTALRPQSVRVYDPQGDGQENDSEVGNVIDGDPSTAWRTDSYQRNATFGNLKKGVGLLLDMGHPVTVRQATVRLGSQPGTSFELRVCAAVPDCRTVAQADNAAGQVDLSVTHPVTGQYVLVWLTRLAPATDAAGRWQSEIDEIAVRGTP